ncbi:MAG: hypothetical protein WD749_08255 [Phycisphaerales bacterium]
MTRRLLINLLVLIAAGLAPAGAALGQAPGQLPNEVVEAQAVNAQHEKQIDDLIEQAVALMLSENPPDARRGRDMLLAPMRNPRVTVAFRIAFGGRLAPKLKPLASGTHDGQAINALRVLGEVATPETGLVLEGALADPRIAVKYAAINGIGRTFAAMVDRLPAMPAGFASGLVRKVGDLVTTEQHPEALDAAVRALMNAQRVTSHASVRDLATVVLAEQAGGRLKGMGAQEPCAPAMLRALNGVRGAMTINDPSAQPTAAAVRKAAELAGHAVAYVVRNLPEFKDSPGEPQKGILNEAETILSAASQKAGPPVYASQRLGDEFVRDPAREFYRKALQTIQWLHGKPFDFPPGTFLKDQEGAGGG